ncbi:MAG: PEP-CTERM sorting domain-containing protein [Microcystis aeruginosa Ma_QC_C_20070703_M131]|uniref:PEP-CTERM sorting domain-containing protein n=1 Tax=Microcystis aeruginosa Ma_QC_C_20070703_M131 TaxID=2486263 RepID=A0A551X5P4_MICAE|nr:MAG: PEP-CTERM sorting domain-containing protein [Microcystis aeruginosa Ma_QC_C_20070703_M131]
MKTAIKPNQSTKPLLQSLSVAMTSALLLGVTALPSKASMSVVPIDIAIDDGTLESPFLPLDPTNPDGFRFFGIAIVQGQIFFFDPDVAVGYDYAVTGDALFASVLIPAPLPNGDSSFTLELPGGVGSFPLTAGTTFNLLDYNALGFSSFRISGIDTMEMLDPTNPLAFVTGLSFTSSGTVNVTQNPIVVNIPEPSSLLSFGLLGLGFGMKKLKK